MGGGGGRRRRNLNLTNESICLFAQRSSLSARSCDSLSSSAFLYIKDATIKIDAPKGNNRLSSNLLYQ